MDDTRPFHAILTLANDMTARFRSACIVQNKSKHTLQSKLDDNDDGAETKNGQEHKHGIPPLGSILRGEAA